jgi:hypothetical protein
MQVSQKINSLEAKKAELTALLQTPNADVVDIKQKIRGCNIRLKFLNNFINNQSYVNKYYTIFVDHKGYKELSPKMTKLKSHYKRILRKETVDTPTHPGAIVQSIPDGFSKQEPELAHYTDLFTKLNLADKADKLFYCYIIDNNNEIWHGKVYTYTNTDYFYSIKELRDYLAKNITVNGSSNIATTTSNTTTNNDANVSIDIPAAVDANNL